MAVTSLNIFRTQPGKLAEHLATTAEAIGHFRRLGVHAMSLQAIAGGDIGSISTSIGCANNADWAKMMQTVGGDAAWQSFWSRVTSDPSAIQVESSLFADVDPNYQPSPDRPVGVILATQWRSRPGRMMDFMGNVMSSMPHVVRMGGSPRALQSVIGAHPMTTLVSVGFADLDAYGAYADKTASDEQWQAFWAGAMADPSADMIRSGLYLNISG
jgi:hypothetical protein